jgi:hypothetical protein
MFYFVLVFCTDVYVVRHKKYETNHIAREPRLGGERQTAIEHVLTCHSVTRLSWIAVLSASGRIFKHRRVLILGRKMSDCKSERVNIEFLVKMKKPRRKLFSYETRVFTYDPETKRQSVQWKSTSSPRPKKHA